MAGGKTTRKKATMMSLVTGQSIAGTIESISNNWEVVGSAFQLIKEIEESTGKKCVKMTAKGKPFILLTNGNRIYFSPRKSWEQYLDNLDQTEVWRTKVDVKTDKGDIIPTGVELIVLPSSGVITEVEYDLDDYE